MRAVRRIVAIAALAFACEDNDSLTLPAETFESYVFVVAEEDELQVFALEGDALALDLGIKESSEIYVLGYQRPLSALGLGSGQLMRSTDLGISLRSLPATSSAFRASKGGDGYSWIEYEVDDRIKNFRFEALSLAQCLGIQGCYDGVRDFDGAATCSTPCPGTMPSFDIAAPALPAPPSPPVMGPCRVGWTTVAATASEVAYCVPNFPPFRDCAANEASFWGQTECSAIGRSCPVDGFGVEPAEEASTVFVDGGTAAGGDGSRANPLRTWSEGVARARDFGLNIIALAPGSFNTDVDIDFDVTIRGACVAQTVLECANNCGAVVVRGSTVSISELTLRGELAVGVMDGGFAKLDNVFMDAVSGVRIEGASSADVVHTRIDVSRGSALSVTGSSRLMTRDVVALGGYVGLSAGPGAHATIERTTFGPSGGDQERTGMASNGATIVLRETLFLPPMRDGIIVDAGRMEMTDLYLRGPILGHGIIGRHVERFEGVGVALEGQVAFGTIFQEGTQLFLEDVDLNDIGVPDAAEHGLVLILRANATGEIERMHVRGHGRVAVSASMLTLRDYLQTSEAFDEFDAELTMVTGATVAMERGQLSTTGLWLTLIGARLSLNDVELRDRGGARATNPGLYVESSTVEATRLRFASCPRACLDASHSLVVLRDLDATNSSIDSTPMRLTGGRLEALRIRLQGDNAGFYGISSARARLEDFTLNTASEGDFALNFSDHTRLEVHRGQFEGPHQNISSDVLSDVYLEDILVRGSRAQQFKSHRSRSFEAHRLAIEDSTGIGFSFYDTSAILDQIRIDGIMPEARGTGLTGIGVMMGDGATVMFRAFSIRHTSDAAINFTALASASFSQGVVADNTFGVAVTNKLELSLDMFQQTTFDNFTELEVR